MRSRHLGLLRASLQQICGSVSPADVQSLLACTTAHLGLLRGCWEQSMAASGSDMWLICRHAHSTASLCTRAGSCLELCCNWLSAGWASSRREPAQAHSSIATAVCMTGLIFQAAPAQGKRTVHAGHVAQKVTRAVPGRTTLLACCQYQATCVPSNIPHGQGLCGAHLSISTCLAWVAAVACPGGSNAVAAILGCCVWHGTCAASWHHVTVPGMLSGLPACAAQHEDCR